MGKTNANTMAKYKRGQSEGMKMAKGQANKLGPTAADKGDTGKAQVGWSSKAK